MALPLAGIRIVEFDAIGPVPLAGMIMADMGADIVRVIRPGGVAMGGQVLNRGKVTVEADLKSADGRAVVLDLVARADALMEGLRPGAMERLGLGPAECHAVNRRLAYGRMTGWGQAGPLSPTAGHDLCYIALTGALHAIGPADGPPTVPLNLIGDYGGGTMFLALGLVAAILDARNTGKGRVVDAAMTDGAAVLMSMFYAFHGAGLWRDQRQSNLLDGGVPWYRCYACADGRHVAVGALEPQFYAALLAGLGLDPETHRQDDRPRWPEIEASIAAVFATRPRDQWAEHFAATDACVAPVLSLAEAPDHPHNVARGTYFDHEGITQPAPAPRFGDEAAAVRPQTTATIAEAVARWARRESGA